MKKLMFITALIVSAFTFVNAQEVKPAEAQPKAKKVVTVQDEWKEVKLETLAPAVQTAIKAQLETYDVKTISYQEATKQTKVVLVSKADKKEKIVYLDSEGKEVKKV